MKRISLFDKNIELEAKNKAKAKVYVGQKMSALDFDALDDNIQQYLVRNAQGIVEMR